jgi:hypothetical protein
MTDRESVPQPRDARQLLIEELEAAKEDPLRSVLSIERTLGVNVGARIGFKKPINEQRGDVDFSPDQIETIDFLRSWTSFLCHRGILALPVIGLWMEQPLPELKGRTPLDFVCNQLRDGIDQEEVFTNILPVSDSPVRPEPPR